MYVVLFYVSCRTVYLLNYVYVLYIEKLCRELVLLKNYNTITMNVVGSDTMDGGGVQRSG